MSRREMTAEDADDFISEYGSDVTPVEVWAEGRDDMVDADLDLSAA